MLTNKLQIGQPIQYNIVMPVVYKDFSFMKRTLKYVLLNLDPQKIYIILDTKYIVYLSKDILNNDRIVVLDENKLTEGLSYKEIDSLLKQQGRSHTKPGWYFQQFLKMGFALSDYCDTEYYLVWDSDTIPLRKIVFFDEENHPFFSMKFEYHKPYFDTMEKILGIGKLNSNSFIAEHMMFNTNVMKDLIKRISASNILGNTWYQKIINSLVDETISPFSFSEFETYGTFCNSFYPDLYRERQIPGLRKGALIQGRFISDRIIENLSTDMYVASFEIYDRPPFPWGVICDMYERYLKYKEMWVKKRVK